MKKGLILKIANLFTFLRILIIPFFSFIYIYKELLGIKYDIIYYILIIILMICEITDLIDGFLARKRNEVTDFGKIFDPMADSIVKLVVLFTFTYPPVKLPLMLIFVFLYREIIISSLRTICAIKGVALAARKSGKIKSTIQAFVNFFILFFLLLYTYEIFNLYLLHLLSVIFVSIAAVYNGFSGIEYLYVNRAFIKKVLKY